MFVRAVYSYDSDSYVEMTSVQILNLDPDLDDEEMGDNSKQIEKGGGDQQDELTEGAIAEEGVHMLVEGFGEEVEGEMGKGEHSEHIHMHHPGAEAELAMEFDDADSVGAWTDCTYSRCVCVFVGGCISAGCVRACVRVCVHACLHACVRVCTCVLVCMRTCVRATVRACECLYVSMCVVCARACARVYVGMCLCACKSMEHNDADVLLILLPGLAAHFEVCGVCRHCAYLSLIFPVCVCTCTVCACAVSMCVSMTMSVCVCRSACLSLSVCVCVFVCA